MSEQHTLYRFKDEHGRLLYVGITNNPAVRMNQHRADKPWWDQVATMEMEHHPSREALAEAEREAIRNELPYWNTIHDATTLDERLGALFEACPLAWTALTIKIKHDISKGRLFEVDRVIRSHRGLIPVQFHVVHQDLSVTRYVSSATTATVAMPLLAGIVGWEGVGLS